ncbi:MAG: holin family protein [Lachnospirales bacterium]
MDRVKALYYLVSVTLGVALGGFDGFTVFFLLLISFDFLTGVMVGILDHNLSSKIGIRGLFKKFTMLLVIILANFFDLYIVGDGSLTKNIAISAFSAMELASLIENSAKLGVPLPEKLKEVFLSLKA